MEPYPHHYARRVKVDELPIDSTLCFVLDELQKMETQLGDRIEGHYNGIEHHVVESRVIEAKESFITLEMALAEVDQGRSTMEKQSDDLKLEVHCMNHLLERDNMVNSQGTPGLIHNMETTSPAVTATGPDRHRSASHTREHESRMVNPAHVPANGMSHTTIPLRAADSSLDSCRGMSHGAQFDGGRAGQGCLPKLNFPMFSGEDPQLWRSRCKNYFEMYAVESLLWLRVASMHFEGVAARWWQSVERRFRTAN
jgi:hypothetical protein